MDQSLEYLLAQELYDRNLIKAINTRVLPVIAYTMNVCTFTTRELDELDMTVKRALRKHSMHIHPNHQMNDYTCEVSLAEEDSRVVTLCLKK